MSNPKEQAEQAKDLGNKAFKAKDWPKSIKHFGEAIGFAPDNAAYYSNRSAAYVKADKLAEALADADKCVELSPEWGKGYARKGSVLLLLKDYVTATACYTAGLVVDPENELLIEGLAQAQSAGGKKKKKNKKKKKVEGKDGEENKDEYTDYVIGIDLGTTYSCVGVWINDGVTIIEDSNGEKTIPSYVSFDKETGARSTGSAAKNAAIRNPTNTVYDVKRVIGQRFTDVGVEQDAGRMQYALIAGDDGSPVVEVEIKGEKQQFKPEEISAMILTKCKDLAEKFLGQPVKRAVVTVPAYFNDSQRNATKAAGRIAGMDILRIINEPTAAALSYGLDNQIKDGKVMNVLIFDLGGGTFDVSILTIEGGIFTVKATGGDTRLGGEDFDNNLVEHFLTEVEKAGIPSPRNDPRSMQRLRKAAEACKRELSKSQSAEVRLDAFKGTTNFACKVTRAKFESLQKSPFAACLDTVKRVLKDAKLKPDAVDEIVLVGGSTRIPKLQEMLVEMFGKPLCQSLNPDEAVAYGAAVQGAILCGKRNSKTDSLLLMDVTPLSLGIETTGRVMSVVIPRNTPIPCVKTQTYTTEANYQTKVDVSVYEGERLKSDENNLLGEFTISGIESAKRGEPQVDVSFSIDSNGILNVTAKDQKTGAHAKIQISSRSRATTEEIDKMVAEAEKYAGEDKERVKKIELKNDMEQLIFECQAAAKEMDNAKMANILSEAADKEAVWLEEHYHDAKASDIALHRRALNRRLEGRQR